MPRGTIDLEADIQPVSDFRANASSVLEQVRVTGRPVVLTQRGRGAAVLLDIRAYQDLVEELEELRDVHRALADVSAGRTTAHADVVARVQARLGS
jgi:antitoxin YefM